MAKCPKCEKIISAVEIEAIDGRVRYQSKYKCISYSCPFCHSLLSVQIDPIAIKADTVDELFKKLRGF